MSSCRLSVPSVRGVVRAGVAVLGLALGCGPLLASTALDTWRSEAQRVRQLAESDAPLAYQEALQLQSSLPPDGSAADRARALNLLARAELYLADTEHAATHAQRAFEIAKAAGDRVGQAEADLNVALNSINEGRLDKLMESTTRSLTLLDGVPRPDLLGEAMLRTAMMYRRTGQIEQSVTMAMQAMQIARQSNDPFALAFAYQGLGVSYAQSFRAQEARDNFEKMLGVARTARSRVLEASALQGLSDVAGSRAEYATADKAIQEALRIYREIGMPFYLAHAQFGLSELLRMQGRQREALAALDEVEAIYRRHPNHIGLWYTLNGRSLLEQQLGDLAQAQAHALKAYAIAKDIGFPQYTATSAQRLATLAAARGDYKRAHELDTEAGALNAQAARENSSARMLDLARHYELQAHERAIGDLKHHNELQGAELERRSLERRWLWTLLVGVAIVLVIGSWTLLRLRRSRDAIRDLNAGLEERVAAATAESRQQASYLRTLIDTLPLMVWLKDTTGRYLAVNQATARACGRAVDDMVGKRDNELWTREVAQGLKASDDQVIDAGQRQTYEAPLAVREGPAWYEVHKAPVLDGDQVIGLVGAAGDVSDRKATEQARERALAEARRLAQQRSEFLAQMSHELRTPLNGILGFAQILQRDKPLSERQTRGLSIIQESGQHLLTLINDILDLARIDAAKLELNPGDIDLRSFLAVVGDIVLVKAEEKHVLFHAQLDERLPRSVRADEKRLRQVLLNLLSNAVKFTDRGEVVLGVRLLEAEAAQARLRFEVIDSGIGMNDEQLARLFQPFEQVADAKHREGGTGLGLAISRQLVRLMGGDIEVESEAGRGSRFWFDVVLPVVEVGAATVRRQAPPIGYEGPRRRILVVDDAAQNRGVLVDGLTLFGFEVREAADGAAAIESALALQPDVVVMDILMPVLDGLQATRRLHALPGLDRVPVIAVSGTASAEVEQESASAGAVAFVTKPVDQEALIMMIGRLLDLQWIHEEAPALPDTGLRDDAELPAPAPHELEELSRLARVGNMRHICDHADRLEQRDARYAPLSRRLRTLAQGCQTRDISRLVERLRARTPEPGSRPVESPE
jgi:PAS domain S-box-containing protein